MTNKQNAKTIENLLDERAEDALQRQQLIMYLVATGLVIVGMTMHLCGILGSNLPELHFLSIVDLFFCTLTFIMWMLHKVSVRKAFNITSVIVQAVQTTKILFVSFVAGQSYEHLVVMNGIISMMLMTVLAISYLRYMSIFVSIANGLTLLAAGMIINNRVLWQYIILILLFTFFFTIMADMMYKNVKHMKNMNIEFQNNEQNLLTTVRMNRKEINAYLEMCRTQNPNDGDADRLFGMLSEKSQRNVINAVERKKANDASHESDIKHRFPDFTPMEVEITRLVLKGMKLSQIINITGKSEANISVVRSRIRKKLGLEPGEDLRNALLQRMSTEEDN